MLVDGEFGRHGDGRDLAIRQAQGILEEGTDLRQTALDAGLLSDDGGGFFGGPRGVVPEILFQRLLVFGQGTGGTLPVAAAQLRQATLQVVVEVAPDRA